MDIKIDRVFSSQVPTSPFYSEKVFKSATLERFQTRKPFDLKALSNSKKKTDHFEFWVRTQKENHEKTENIEAHLKDLLKTPVPLHSFELAMAYKSNKTTYQSPIPLWIYGDQTGPSNPLDFEYLIYERMKDEILAISTHKKKSLPTQLMAKGRLLMNEHGYFFLKFKEPYFKHYLNTVQRLGGHKPNFLENNSVLGFHMGVIMPTEYQDKKLWGKVREIGKEFYVGISGCFQINLKDHPEYEKIWVLKMECQQLVDLRERYGLSPSLNGHAFMMVLGYKKRVNPLRMEEGTYRMNPAIYAV